MYVVVIYHVQDLKSCPQAATSSRALRPIFFACRFAIAHAHGAWVTVFLEMAEATGGAGAARCAACRVRNLTAPKIQVQKTDTRLAWVRCTPNS